MASSSRSAVLMSMAQVHVSLHGICQRMWGWPSSLVRVVYSSEARKRVSTLCADSGMFECPLLNVSWMTGQQALLYSQFRSDTPKSWRGQLIFDKKSSR